MLKKFLIILLSLFILCGCSSKETKEVITFTSWGSLTEVKVIKKIISDFELENPDIKVKFVHIPQNYFQKIHLLFASNTAPDVLFINNLYLPIYANKLLDLSEKIEKNVFFDQAILGLSFEGRLLAAPRDVSNLVLYINKEIVKESSKDWSLESLLAVAKNVTQKNVYGISFEPEAYYLLPYLAYFGEELTADFIPEKSKGFLLYTSMRDYYKIAPTKSQVGSLTLAQMFLEQKVAIYLSGRWMYPKISEKADFSWEVESFPLGKMPLPCDASGWAISKDTKHLDSALKFIKYLSSAKSSEYFTETGLIVPAQKEIAQLLNNNEHNEKIFLEVVQNSKNTKATKDYKKLVDKVNLRIME